MSAGEDSIRQLIQKMVKGLIPTPGLICEVISVDKSASTCKVQPLNGDAEIFGVKLQADETDKYGVIPIPKEGSKVVVSWLSRNVAFVSLIAEIESHLIQIDTVTLFVDSNGIEINGTDHGGLTITPVLRTELNKTTTRILALEVALLAFCGAMIGIATAVPLFAPLIPGWTALQAALGALPPQGLYNTNIESNKVKHGSN